MIEKILNLLGLMRKANSIAVGETNTGAAVRGGKAKLMLMAHDASDNARHRAEGFAAGRSVLTAELPFTKEELAASLGMSGCSMAAVTDMGFANALLKLLAAQWPENYGELAAQMEQRFSRAERRKTEAAAHERNKRSGKRRTNA